jgi:hypothetical protein
MSVQEVNLELLLGRRVRARNGRSVGRIEEFRVERRGDAYEVVEYLLGPGALARRLGVVGRLLRPAPRALIARWDQIDVTDIGRPVLTTTVDQLTERDD